MWAGGQQVEWAGHGCKVTMKREGMGRGSSGSGIWRIEAVGGVTPEWRAEQWFSGEHGQVQFGRAESKGPGAGWVGAVVQAGISWE